MKIGIIIDGALRDLRYRFLQNYAAYYNKSIDNLPKIEDINQFVVSKSFEWKNELELSDFIKTHLTLIFSHADRQYDNLINEYPALLKFCLGGNHTIHIFSKENYATRNATTQFLSMHKFVFDEFHFIKSFKDKKLKSMDFVITGNPEAIDVLKDEKTIVVKNDATMNLESKMKINKFTEIPHLIEQQINHGKQKN